MLSFQAAVSALTYSIIDERCGDRGQRERFPHNRVTRFVLAQHTGMPDHLRLALRGLVLAFDAWPIPVTGRPFHRLPHGRRWRAIERWRRSRLGFRRNLVKFFESLVILAWFADSYAPWRDDRAPAG